MMHFPSMYGCFEEVFRDIFFPEQDLNYIALHYLLPSGLKNAKKSVIEKDSAGKKHRIDEELLYLYKSDPNRLSKIRKEYYQKKGGRIRLTNEILNHYKDANAPKRCAKSFKRLCSRSLPDLLDFVKELRELMKNYELSPAGRDYLDYLYSQKRNEKQSPGEEKLLFISECFIYCILEEEPTRWAKLLKYIKDHEATTIKSSKKYGYINFPYKRNRFFVERKSNNSSDLARLVYDEGVIALYGVTGSGKTQIALEVGYNLSENGTVIWIDSSDKSQLASSLKASLQAMGVTIKSDSFSGLLFEFKSVIENLDNCYLIFDDLTESYDDFEVVLAATESAKSIITSQKYVEINDIRNVNIREFELCDSVSYLTKRLGAHSYNETEGLAKRLYNQPLALAQASSYLIRNKQVSISDYISMLDETELRILKGNSTVSEHKIAIYDSILISMNYINTKNESSYIFARIISFFKNYGINSIFLNRVFFWPYVFNRGNYKYDKKKQVAVPYLYSNCGKGAIDEDAKRYFRNINLPLYDMQSFFSIIKILEDFDLCRVKYYKAPTHKHNLMGEISSYNLYKQITGITMHGLVQEVLLSSVLDDEPQETLKYIDIISHLLLFGGKRKPFMMASEAISLGWVHIILSRYVLDYKDAFMSSKYKDICESLVSASSIMYYIEVFHARRIECEPMRIYQEEIWGFIIEYYEKYCNIKEYYLRLLEYCLIFPLYEFEKSREYFNKGLRIVEYLDARFASIVLKMADKIKNTDDLFMYESHVYRLLNNLYPMIGLDFRKHMAFVLLQVGDDTRDEILKIFLNEHIQTERITYDEEYLSTNDVIAFIPTEGIDASDYMFIDPDEINEALFKDMKENPSDYAMI